MDKSNFMKRVIFKRKFGGFDYSKAKYKSCRYLDLDNECTGFIIGEYVKYEGEYTPESYYDGEFTPGILSSRKGIWFYQVAVEYNHIELVNRNDAIMQDDAKTIINAWAD